MTAIATVQVTSGAGYTQRIQAGAHTLIADEPASNGGTDAGPAPYALLLASLGACTSITLQMYAKRKGWTLGQVEVALRMLKGKEGEGDQIERIVTCSAPLSDEQRTRLVEICDKTPVTRTLKAGIPIATELKIAG